MSQETYSFEKTEKIPKFKETREPFGEYTKITIENTNTGMKLELIPEIGAKINGLSFNNGAESIEVIDGYKTPEELERNAFSKSSMLGPFPNRVADGKYSFEGKDYQLPINMPDENNAIHGFIEHKRFEVVASGQKGGAYEIHVRHESKGENQGYPFPFVMDIVYRLIDKGLETNISVENRGDENMPFGHGWHPYFKTKGSVKNLELQLPKVEQICVDGRLVPTGERIDFTDFKELKVIGDTQFDTGFKLSDGEGRVVLIDRENNLQIAVVMGGAYGYFQVFTPPEESPAGNSIAVEPMTCEANAFNSGRGLVVLAPRERFEGSYSIEIGTIEH